MNLIDHANEEKVMRGAGKRPLLCRAVAGIHIVSDDTTNVVEAVA